MPDVVFVSHLSLLNDELSVKQHKSTHDDQAKVHVSRKQHDRPQEHVEERDHEQDGQSRHQSTSKEEVAPALGVEGTQREAQKDDGCPQEGCHNDAWVNRDDIIHGWAQTNTCEEGKTREDGQSLLLSQRAVGSHSQPSHHGQGAQHGQHPTLEEPGDDMDVGSCCSHKHAQGQAGVDILQVELSGAGDLGKF